MSWDAQGETQRGLHLHEYFHWNLTRQIVVHIQWTCFVTVNNCAYWKKYFEIHLSNWTHNNCNPSVNQIKQQIQKKPSFHFCNKKKILYGRFRMSSVCLFIQALLLRFTLQTNPQSDQKDILYYLELLTPTTTPEHTFPHFGCIDSIGQQQFT